MTYLIPGCTAAEHAAFFGTAWYEEDDPTTATPHKEVTRMYGQKPICQVCTSQIRPVDNPTDTGCRDNAAEFGSQTCTAFKPLPPEKLALRIAELYNYTSLAWDMIMAVLNLSAKLPEVKK